MKTAIVGYGKMGQFYDKLMPAAYIVDTFPIPGRISFTNVDEFIQYAQPVDLVILATPTFTHFDLTKKLLAGNYNVLIEKPITLSSNEAFLLEHMAEQKGLTLYQSTLERYNPLIKFLRHNVQADEVSHIKSFRYGNRPSWRYTSSAIFDLGIHDVDLWFYVFKGMVDWTVHAGYDKEPRREIIVELRSGETITLNLLTKSMYLPDGRILDFAKSSTNNPMLEMLYDLSYQQVRMNERWHKAIRLIEKHEEGTPLRLQSLHRHSTSS